MLDFPVDEFFHLDDFASEAVYTDGDGHPSAIPVIFIDPYTSTEGMENTRPEARCRTKDIPKAAQGETLTINNKIYYILEPMPNGHGVTRLLLSEDQI